MNSFARRQLPLIIASFGALLMVFEYYFKTDVGSSMADLFRSLAIVAASWTFVLAFVLVTIRHVNIVRKQTKGRDRYFSTFMLVVLWGMTVMGLGMGPKYQWFVWLFINVNPIVYGSMIGTTAFFVASAAYRALRMRTLETSVLLVIAVIAMLGNVTIGEVVWRNLPAVTAWVMDVGQSAGMRGLEITIGFGVVALSMRIISWLETRWLGE